MRLPPIRPNSESPFNSYATPSRGSAPSELRRGPAGALHAAHRSFPRRQPVSLPQLLDQRRVAGLPEVGPEVTGHEAEPLIAPLRTPVGARELVAAAIDVDGIGHQRRLA